MITRHAQAFPTPGTRLTDAHGTLTIFARKFFQSMYDRGGGANGLPSVNGTPTVAGGNGQATAPVLTNDRNLVGTVAPGTGHMLPPMQVGADCFVFNQGQNPMSVWPQPGQQIDALGVNTAYTLANGKMQRFHMMANNQLYSSQFG